MLVHRGLIAASLCSGLALMAAEAPPDAKPASTAAVPATAATESALAVGTNAVVASTNALAAATNALAGAESGAAAVSTNSEPPITVSGDPDDIVFNFHGAPLQLVLETMSDAAGFIINNQVEDSLRGKVEIWSKKPVTPDEAVELLDSALRKNKYAVSRNDRILTIFSLSSAKTSSEVGVKTVRNWKEVEPTDDIGTYVIPVSYISATQLKANLMVFLPLETELTVNESANSLVMVAPARDVRRALKIINALDTSTATGQIRVFRLRFADAKQLATEVMTLFSQNPQGGMGGGFGRAMAFAAMMGRGGGMPGMGGPGGSATTTPAGARVSATSDDYSNSLIVSAAPEVMESIAEMVEKVDVTTTEITEVKVFQLKHADANQLADQINALFPDTSRTDTGPGFGFMFRGPFGGGRGGQATSNTRDKKMSQVIAVPEPRTRSLMISAPHQLMDHLGEIINALDTDARHEVVKVFELANADPQDVYQVLQDLFQRSGNIRQNNNNNRNSMIGSGNPLTTR
jgi:general secretion pathway protein D